MGGRGSSLLLTGVRSHSRAHFPRLGRWRARSDQAAPRAGRASARAAKQQHGGRRLAFGRRRGPGPRTSWAPSLGAAGRRPRGGGPGPLQMGRVQSPLVLRQSCCPSEWPRGRERCRLSGAAHAGGEAGAGAADGRPASGWSPPLALHGGGPRDLLPSPCASIRCEISCLQPRSKS